MTYEIITLAISGAAMAVSGTTLGVLTYERYIRPRIESKESKSGYFAQLAEAHIMQLAEESGIPRPLKSNDPIWFYKDGQQRPAREVCSELSGIYDRWRKLPWWRKAIIANAKKTSHI